MMRQGRQWLWHLWHGLRRLGASGCLGLLLLAAAAGGHFLWEARKAALTRQERQLAADAVRLRANLSAIDGGRQDAEKPLPSERDFTQVLRQLTAAAADAGLDMGQVDYKAPAEADGRWLRYGLSFPANGAYPALRRFLARADALPGLRLDALQVSRTRIDESRISARVQFDLVLEAE